MACADIESMEVDNPPDIGQLFASVPAKALNVSSRKILSKHLNPAKVTLSQDWKGLAELCDFDYLDIENFCQYQDPTKAVLEEWCVQEGATIGKLVENLKSMGRYDVLEDPNLLKFIERDVQTFKRREQQRRIEYEQSREPIQVAEVSSHMATDTDHYVDEYKFLTKNEVETGEVEYFDGFVCYTYNDFMWVKQMMKMIEEKFELKLCIIGRDLMPGTSKYTAIAKLIKDRCKKVIIVLSPDYLRSDECDFMTKFAHSLSPGSRSKKLVPVLIRTPCPMPNILRYITLIDYTKCDLVEWFWERLACSLKEPMQSRIEVASIEDENKTLQFTQLSDNEINMNIPDSYLKGKPKTPIPMKRLSSQEDDRALSQVSTDMSDIYSRNTAHSLPQPLSCPTVSQQSKQTLSSSAGARVKTATGKSPADFDEDFDSLDEELKEFLGKTSPQKQLTKPRAGSCSPHVQGKDTHDTPVGGNISQQKYGSMDLPFTDNYFEAKETKPPPSLIRRFFTSKK